MQKQNHNKQKKAKQGEIFLNGMQLEDPQHK